MEFHDFQIRAWTVDRNRAAVIVHSSSAGAMHRPETVILDEDALTAFRKIFQSTSASAPAEVTPLQLTDGGRVLARIVLPEQVANLLSKSLELIGLEDGLRVRLCLDGTLSDLPWEYLTLPDGIFLGLDARVSLVREPPQPGRQKPALRKRQRLLFFETRLCSTPVEDLWKTAEEKDKLFQALDPASPILETRATLSNETDCQTALMRSKMPIDIFHYSGLTDVDNGNGYLVAHDLDSEERNVDRLCANTLGPLLRRA